MKNKDLADELCITYAGLYNKLNKNRDFSEDELTVLYQLFGNEIFFLDFNVSKMKTNYARHRKKNRTS